MKHGGDEQHEALDQIEVAARGGVDEQLADAVDVEHLLGDDQPADQERELEADDGDDGQQRVAQGMAAHDEPGPHALGAGGADIVLAHHLEQRGTHHARRHGGIAVADRGGRPDRDRQVGDRVLPERHIADLGQPIEQRQQRQNDQHAEPERGYGQARDRDHPHRVVDPGVAVERRDGAERDGDQHGDHARHDGDLEGHGHRAARSP